MPLLSHQKLDACSLGLVHSKTAGAGVWVSWSSSVYTIFPLNFILKIFEKLSHFLLHWNQSFRAFGTMSSSIPQHTRQKGWRKMLFSIDFYSDTHLSFLYLSYSSELYTRCEWLDFVSCLLTDCLEKFMELHICIWCQTEALAAFVDNASCLVLEKHVQYLVKKQQKWLMDITKIRQQ